MLTYLLQMIACSGILYGYYHFFLRNEKFHQYNRFYLLFAMVVSIVLPLFKIPVELSKPDNSPIYVFVSTGENIVVTARQSFNWLNVVYMGYTLLAFFFVVKLILAILKIQRIKKDADTERFPEFKFIKTAHEDAPFSFFNWLFWNQKNRIDSSEGRHIFKHELYHIRNKHSWDLLFIEIILCIFWFNPFYYLYRKEIKIIQEFLADKHATENTDINEYAKLLVFQAAGIHTQKLITPFFHNQLKRRIAMLLSSKKPQHHWLRKLLVLPLAAVVITLFAFSYKKAEEKSFELTSPFHVLNTLKNADLNYETSAVKKTFKISSDTVPRKKVSREPEVFSKVEVDAAFPGGPTAWRNFLQRNLQGDVPLKNGAPAGRYTSIVQFIVDVEGNVSDVKALTKTGYGIDEEAVRVIEKSGKWSPAIVHGKNVKAYRKQPITFQVIDDTKGGKKENLGIATPPIVENEEQTKREPEVFTKVEIDPAFPGSWQTFLMRNLDGAIPINNKAPEGTYTVVIQFIVDKEGNISDIKPITNVGYGMEGEAMRVIKKAGKWKPAMQNGRIVKAYKKQPITFEITKA